MPQPEEIPFSESARNKRRQFQTKGLGSRLGRALSSRAIDRPRIGKRKRSIRGTDIDLPTGGIRGSKKPTGTNIDVDRDGWVDEGTRRPRWVGLSSAKPEEVVRTRIDKSRPIIKINKPEEKIDKSRAHKLKNYKYGDESALGGRISITQGPDWLKGLTNEQISSLLVPDSIETQYRMWLDNYGAGSLIKGSSEEVKFRKWFDDAIEAKEYNKFDYSPESRAATRKAVEAALEDSPLFSWAVRNYGSPVFGVVTPKGRDEYVARPQYKALIAKFANSSVDKDKPIFPKAMASLDLNMVSFFPNYVIDREAHDIDGLVPMNMNPLHVPSRDDAVMNRSLAGTVVHEWAHWLHQMALRDSERMGVKSERKYFGNNTDERYIAALRVAAEYSDTSKDFLKLHEDRVPFEDSPKVPRTVTSYGHANMREAMAEGMVAYMHPNQDLKNYAINDKLRKDVETLLGGKDGTGPWAKEIDKQTSLGSGRRERRSNPKGIRLEKTIPGEKRRNSLSSGAEEKIEFESVQKSVEDLLDLTATYFDIPDDTEGPLDVRARERANTRVFRQTKDSGVPDEPITPDEWFSMDVMEVRRVSMDALDLNGQPTGEKINVIMHSPRMHEIEERARGIGESVHQEVLTRLEKVIPEGTVRPEDVKSAREKIDLEIAAIEQIETIEAQIQVSADEAVEKILKEITSSDGRGMQGSIGSRYWNFSKVDTAKLSGSGQDSIMTPEAIEGITELKQKHIEREKIINDTLEKINELVKLGFLAEVTDASDRHNGRRVFVPKSIEEFVKDFGITVLGPENRNKSTPAIIVHDIVPTTNIGNVGMVFVVEASSKSDVRRYNITPLDELYPPLSPEGSSIPEITTSEMHVRTPWRDVSQDSDDLIHISEIIKSINSVALTSDDLKASGGVSPGYALPEDVQAKRYSANYREQRTKLINLMRHSAGARATNPEETNARLARKSKLRSNRREILVPYRMAYRDALMDVMNELLDDNGSKKPDLMTATGGMGAEKLNEVARRFLPSEIIRQINLRFGEGDYPYKKVTRGRYKTTKKGIYAIKKASGGGEAHFAENNELLGYLQPDGQLIAAGYPSITIPDGSMIIRGNDSVKVNVDESDGSNLHELTHVITFANPLASLLENLFFQRRMAGGRKGKREESLSKRINRGATRPTLNKLTDTNWEGDYGNPVGTGKTPRKKRSLPDMQVFDDQFLRTYQGRVYSEKQSTPSKETFTVGMQNLFVPEEEIVASPEIDHDSNNFVIGSLLLVAAQAKRERLNPERQIRNRTSIMVTEPQQVSTPEPPITLSQDVIRSMEISEIDLPVESLSSGKKITPEQRSAIRSAEKTLRGMDFQITEIGFVNKKTEKTRQSPIFSVSGRAVVLVDVNGVRVPFYRSSGSGGKKNVPSGRWYPIFGFGKEQVIYDGYEGRLRANGGWFNKGSEEEIVDYYGVRELREIAENLDSALEDLPNVLFNDVRQEFEKSDVDKVAIGAGVKTKPMHRSINDSLWEIIHRDLHPVNTYRESPRENIDEVVGKIKSGRVRMDMDSLSPTVKKDRLYVSKKSKLIRKREVELEIKDKNGDVIRVEVDAQEDTRYGQAMKMHNVTVRMKKNNREVGVLHARIDLTGELGNPGKLTISEILVPEDFQRRGHGRAMLAFANTYNIGSEKVYHSSLRSELGELFATGTGLSSGKKPLPKIPNKSNMTPGDMQYDNVAGNGDGDCFPAASNLLSSLVLKNPERVNDFRVVHGIPLGTGGDAEGKRFHHAWVEETVKRTDKEVAEMLDRFPEAMREGAKRQLGPMLSEYVIVHDHSNGRELRMPKEVYYAFGQIEEPLVQKYSFTDLSDEQSRVGHHGPYGVDGVDISQAKRGTKQNRTSRRGNIVSSDGGSSLSSGARYEKIVRNQPNPSSEQVDSSRNFKDLTQLDELKKEDVWTTTGVDIWGDETTELADSEDRANIKNDIKQSIEALFSYEIELDESIIVLSNSGEKINLGNKIKITAVVDKVEVSSLEEKDISEQISEIGRIIVGGKKNPLTQIDIKFKISPADSSATEKLITLGVPESLIDVDNPGTNIQLGSAHRSILTDGSKTIINHESLTISGDARKNGIASALNARNESLYGLIDADSIVTYGMSSTLVAHGWSSTLDQIGATHWARNGFKILGEPSKQKFIGVIDDAIINKPGSFSEEEMKRISSLYKKDKKTGKFTSSATAEELIDFAEADEIFKLANNGDGVAIFYTREVAKPSGINRAMNRIKRRVGSAGIIPASSSLSSGAKVSPKERKIQLQKIKDAENYLRNLDLQITELNFVDSETGKEVNSPIFTLDGRSIVLIDVNGIRIPFYQSTGQGGKDNPKGKWYPIFGIGKPDIIYDREFKRFIDRGTWFNKGDTYEVIDDYYGVPEFKRIASILNDIDDLTKISFHKVEEEIPEDEVIELLKKNNSIIPNGQKLPKAKLFINPKVLQEVNRDLTPYSTVGDAERSGGRRWDYLNEVIERIKKNRTNDDKPRFPRKPTYGPFIGRTNEVFGRARTWEEFKDIYEDTEITYIDYETTGLVFDEFNESSGNGFPTQIGAVKMKNGKVVSRFETYINPGIPKEQWEQWSRDTLVDYDGKPITNEFIQKQMSIAEAHRKLAEFIGPNAILGVQNAAFDKDVLEDNLTASGIDWRPDGWIDLKDVAAMSLPRWSEESPDGPKRFDKEKGKFVPSNSLKDITEYLGVELGDKHHTADADAEATAKSMNSLIENAIEKNWSTELFDANNRLQKVQKENEKFNSEIETFRSNKDRYLGIERVSSLSSGGPSKSEREEAHRLRRALRYEQTKAKGEGNESKLGWDENGNYIERVIPSYDLDEDSEEDDGDDGLTPKERAEERAADAAYLEFSKITPEEMAARIKRGEAARERLNSPEYLEESRLKRVARNKGKETNLHNADGTMKVRGGEKLSSGASGNKKFQKQLKLVEEAVSRSSSRGVETYSYKQGDITPELVDELEKEITNFESEVESTVQKIEEEMEKLLDSNKSQKIKDALYEQLDKERESLYKVEESSRLAYLALDKIKSFSANQEIRSASGWTTEIHISRDSAGRITGIAVTGVQMEKQARVLADYFDGLADVVDGKALYIDYVVSFHKEKDSGRTLLGSILEDAERDGVSLVQVEPNDTSSGYWDMFGFTAAKRKDEFAINGPVAEHVFLKLDTPQNDGGDK